jgi:hypothetical protein
VPFPRKFKSLHELTKADLDTPHHVWLTYFVCATTQDSCGWGGWLLDAIFSTAEENPPTGLLPDGGHAPCPRCGKQLFATEAAWRFDVSENQYPRLQPGVDYSVGPIEYED